MALPIQPGNDELMREADQPAGTLLTTTTVPAGSPSAPTSPSSSSTSTTSTATTAVVALAPTPSSPPSASQSSAFSSNGAVQSVPDTIKLDNDIVAVTTTEITSNSDLEDPLATHLLPCTTAISTLSEDPALPEDINLIYFYVGNKTEIALVPTNSSSDDIKGESIVK